MNRRLFAIAILAVFLSGCAVKTAPLPAGAINAVDAQTNATLEAATAAVTQYETDVKGGFVPKPALNTAMQDLQRGLAVAIPAYKAWHAQLQTDPGAGEPAALAAAVASISQSLANLPTTAQ